jgi:hypothetical protein
MVIAGACVAAPSAYTVLALADIVPMTAPIFLAWLGWLQLAHVILAIVLWRQRTELATQTKTALISCGGLAFWYWLPALDPDGSDRERGRDDARECS